jgi:HEAT repeat protein
MIPLSLDSSHQILAAFLFVLLLLGVLYQVGVVGWLVMAGFWLVDRCMRGGFLLWKDLFAWLPRPVLLAVVVGVHGLLWLDSGRHPALPLLLGLLLLFIGVVACLAFMFLDWERYEVGRGYKVRHNPLKGQELAQNLVQYGHRAGLPLLLSACVAWISGFALLNLGLYRSAGRDWYTIGAHSRVARVAEGANDEVREPAYEDFLAYSLLNLASAVDLVDLANAYNVSRIAYVHQARWPASTLLVIFRSFFTLILLQQIMAALRYFRLIEESVKDFWSPHEPIQRLAGQNLAQQGTQAVQYLLQSMEQLAYLTPEQREMLPAVIAQVGPDVTPLLVAHLPHPNPVVREVAVAALGELHALETLPALAAAREDPSESVRLSLAAALGVIYTTGTTAVRKRWRLKRSNRPGRRWLLKPLRRWKKVVEQQYDPVELAVETLTGLLGDTSKLVRHRAAQTLAQIGVPAAPATQALAALAHDEDEEVRQQAAETLGKIGGPADVTIATLQDLLEDPMPAVRVAALKSLGQRRQEATAAVPLVLPLIHDRDESVREAASGALSQIGPLDRQAVAQLIADLKNQDNLVRVQAAEAIGAIGPAAAAAVPVLAQALRDPNDRVRARAAWALGRMQGEGANAVPALAGALRDQDFRVSALAAEALGAIGPSSVSAVKALLQALQHINPEVRKHAAAALARVGAPAKQTVPALSALLHDEEPTVRREALLALGACGDAVREVQEALHGALQDADPQIRTAAVQALSRLGLPEAMQVALLLPALEDASDEVKLEAARVLGRLGEAPESVIKGLCELLQQEDEQVQIGAVVALGKLGPRAAEAGELLVNVLRRSGAALREQVLRALALIQPPEAAAAFLSALHDPDAEVRRWASAGLLKCEALQADALPALVQGLKDPDVQVRANIVLLCGRKEIWSAEMGPLLLEYLNDPDDGLRLSALRILKEISELRLDGVLPRLLNDPNSQIRFLAASILTHTADDPQAVEILRSAIAAEQPRLRRQALETIETLGDRVALFVDALRAQQAAEEDPELRELLGRMIKLADQPPAGTGPEQSPAALGVGLRS